MIQIKSQSLKKWDLIRITESRIVIRTQPYFPQSKYTCLTGDNRHFIDEFLQAANPRKSASIHSPDRRPIFPHSGDEKTRPSYLSLSSQIDLPGRIFADAIHVKSGRIHSPAASDSTIDRLQGERLQGDRLQGDQLQGSRDLAAIMPGDDDAQNNAQNNAVALKLPTF